MKIAVAQINTRAGDFATTSERIVELSRNAAGEGVDLLLLPLSVFTGQCLPDYASCEGFFVDLGSALEELSSSVACPCLVPVATADAGGGYDAILLRDGMSMPVGFMSWLLGDAEGDGEKNADAQGSFEFGGLRFAVAYTYDDIQALEENDADIDVLLYVPERGFALDDPSSALGASLTEGRFRDDAWTLDAWIVGVGSLGGYDLQVFSGSSFVLTPRGELVACAPAFEEALLVAAIDDALPDDGTVAGGGEERVFDDEFVGNGIEVLEPELYDRSMHLWEALSLGLRDVLEKQGSSEVALVLDGRLCSSVLATLASDALGPTHVHALIDAWQGEARRLRAERLASALHLDVREVTGIAISSDADILMCRDVVQSQLAALARSCGAVSLACFDKTYFALEAVVGACGLAAFAPLGDVYRTDLIELAHLRNTISPVIDTASIRSYDVPRISGLDEAESTQEARLRRVDVTLATFIEWERSLTDVVARQGCEEVCTAIGRALQASENEFARMSLPPCIAVSSRTVREMRVPLGLTWHDCVRSDAERLPHGNIFAAASSLGEGGGRRAHSDDAQADEYVTSGIAAMLDRMQAELMGDEPATGGRDAPERQVGELLGLLRDILQDGGLSASSSGGDVPFGPLTWGSPFSEN